MGGQSEGAGLNGRLPTLAGGLDCTGQSGALTVSILFLLRSSRSDGSFNEWLMTAPYALAQHSAVHTLNTLSKLSQKNNFDFGVAK